MHKISRLFLLVCTFAFAGLLHGKTADAAPIAGMVGVGTWNTQADFADVKVVQGSTTLYQSNFAAGFSEWKQMGGTWQTVTGGYLRQTGTNTPALALVGDPAWSNYTLTLRARKNSGAEGFLITFGSPGDNTKTDWNIGGWGNTLSGLEVPTVSTPSVPLVIQTGVWYDIRVEVQGSNIRCYLNGNVIHDTTPQPITGMVGVGTWNTQADFADVKVVQGSTTLYQSNFAAGFSEWKQMGGTWQTVTGGYLRQTGNSTPAMVLVGSPAWNNYTLTLRARKNSGAEGFLITFGSPGDATTTQWNIGGWGNTQHNLQVPGVWSSPINASVQTGVWYDIRVEVQGNDIRCYLNGNPVEDYTRILTYNDRQRRFQDALSSPGFGLLNPWEQGWLTNLAGRSVYLGNAARATFAAMPSTGTFNTLTAAQQAVILRKVNRNRLTWNTGWGFGSDAGRDATIINSTDGAVLFHNQVGLFDSHIIADNSPGTPTADSNYNGEIRFGQLDNYRVALHESSHFLGTGTYWAWGNYSYNGQWHGYYASTQLKQFDGSGAIPGCDTQHYWPYGMNYDNEYSDTNAYRHVLMVHAFRRDMGIATQDVVGATDIPNGGYVLIPRNIQSSALDVLNGNSGAGATLDIHAATSTDSQKFLLDLQSDGTYRIRTALPGNRCIDLLNGDMTNGSKLQLWDDNGKAAQRWYLIPTGDGWYRIAPKNNVYKGLDINGGNSAIANGTAVQNWDYLDGLNQQWKLVPTALTATVTGRLALEGVSDMAAATAVTALGTCHFDFRTPGTVKIIRSAEVVINPVGSGSAYGTFSISNVPYGVYDVVIKGHKSLQVLLRSVTIGSSPLTLADQMLPGGDANDDNVVDIADFGLLVNAYGSDVTIAGSGYDARADFDYNGVIDIGDFGILVNEYNNAGAP